MLLGGADIAALRREHAEHVVGCARAAASAAAVAASQSNWAVVAAAAESPLR